MQSSQSPPKHHRPNSPSHDARKEARRKEAGQEAGQEARKEASQEKIDFIPIAWRME
jgi:hypothetical protein